MPLALRRRTNKRSLLCISMQKKDSELTTSSGIQPYNKAICREKKGAESPTRSGGEMNATTIMWDPTSWS